MSGRHFPVPGMLLLRAAPICRSQGADALCQDALSPPAPGPPGAKCKQRAARDAEFEYGSVTCCNISHRPHGARWNLNCQSSPPDRLAAPWPAPWLSSCRCCCSPRWRARRTASRWASAQAQGDRAARGACSRSICAAPIRRSSSSSKPARRRRWASAREGARERCCAALPSARSYWTGWGCSWPLHRAFAGNGIAAGSPRHDSAGRAARRRCTVA